MVLDLDAVVAAVSRWSFIPHNAVRVETDEYQLLRLPGWWERPLELRVFCPRRPLDEVLDEVLVAGRAFDLTYVCCWVRMDAPAGYEDLLVARGACLDETLDVLARPLDDLPDLDPSGVEVRWATDRSTFRDAMRVGGEVFGGDGEVDDATLDEEFAQEQGKVERGDGGSVVAYLDDAAVGTAGLTLAGPDARLWGGAVSEEARGLGIYRALLDARLRYAVAHGGRLALVKGRVQTLGADPAAGGVREGGPGALLPPRPLRSGPADVPYRVAVIPPSTGISAPWT